MVRERVNIHGHLRPMEPIHEIHVLRLKASQLGILKEVPALRWKKGQDEWDRRYHRTAISALKKRRKLEAKAERLLQNAYDHGFIHLGPYRATKDYGSRRPEGPVELAAPRRNVVRQTSVGKIQSDRRWGPLDLEDELPPLGAIAKRRDTVSTEIYVSTPKPMDHLVSYISRKPWLS